MESFVVCYGNIERTLKIVVLSENTTELNGIIDDSVDLMIASPPYGDGRTTVVYGEFSKLSLQWLDLENLTVAEISNMDKTAYGQFKVQKWL